MPKSARYFKHVNRDYLEWAVGMGLIDKPEPILLQLYSEPIQKFRLAAQGHGEIQPPAEHRERIATYFDPLPLWYMPFEEAAVDRDAIPYAVTCGDGTPGGLNAWLRQIHGENRLHMHRATATALGIADDDWVSVSSHHGTLKAQVKLMEGVNPFTVWTWNAIGKRAGAWNLEPGAGESSRGFLLNHIISEMLPRPPQGQPATRIRSPARRRGTTCG